MAGKVGREGLPAFGEGSLMAPVGAPSAPSDCGRLLAMLGGLVKARISARPLTLDEDAREPTAVAAAQLERGGSGTSH